MATTEELLNQLTDSVEAAVDATNVTKAALEQTVVDAGAAAASALQTTTAQATAAATAAGQSVAARDLTLTYRDTSLTARDVAVAARDASMTAGVIYPDIATGRAASSATTGPDSYFKVLGTGDVSFSLYQRTSSSQTLIKNQPTAEAVTRAALNSYRKGLWELRGDGNPDQVPITVTEGGKVITSQYRIGGQLVLGVDANLLALYRLNIWNLRGDGDPAVVPTRVSAKGKVLEGRSALDGTPYIAGLNTSTLPVSGLAYISGGTLRIMGAGGGDRALNADANKTWLSAIPFAGSALAIYQDNPGGARHLVRISYTTARMWWEGEVTLWTDDGQSNAEAQAGTSVAALMASYQFPDRLRMTNLGVRLGLVTSGGTSVQLNPANITSFVPLGDVVEVTHGTTAVAAAANANSKVAYADCLDWTPDMVVWGNAEGGQTIANLLNDAPSDKYAFSNAVAAVTKAASLLAISKKRLVWRLMLMAQGESDVADTALGTKHALYRSQIETAIKPITGQSESIRMLSWQMSSFFNASQGCRSILDYALSNEVAYGNFWCAGPTYAYPWSDDYLHNSSIGHQMRGELGAAANLEIEKTGFWRPLYMVSASVTGANQITVVLSEAAVNDETAGVDPIANKGIVVPGRTVTAVTVAGSSMTITTQEAAAGATLVQSAMVGHSGTRAQATIPRSTIRSVAAYGTHSTGAVIRKWLTHREISIT